MKPIYLIIAIVVVLGAAIAGFAFIDRTINNETETIQSFEDCVAAGYPIMESYPAQCRTPDGRTFVQKVDQEVDDVRVTNLQEGSTIESPFILEGEARGPWYFEASFSVDVRDDDGNVLGMGIAQAQDEWMTEDFVPFRADISFSPPNTQEGEVVLQKANPSGLPEHAAEVSIPVQFAGFGETTTVQLHFVPSDWGATDCSITESVERTVSRTQAIGRVALEELLKGPNQTEQDRGITTAINPGVEIQSLSVEDGTARVDFNERLDEGVGGSCRVIAIRAQIEKTLQQFPTVDDVVISINGRTETILQP